MKTPPKWDEIPARVRRRVIGSMRQYIEDASFDLRHGYGHSGYAAELREELDAYRAAIALLRSASKKKARRR